MKIRYYVASSCSWRMLCFRVGLRNHHQILIIPKDHDKHYSLVPYKIYGLEFSIARCLHLMVAQFGCSVQLWPLKDASCKFNFQSYLLFQKSFMDKPQKFEGTNNKPARQKASWLLVLRNQVQKTSEARKKPKPPTW
jgi:hypothetical protein